MRSRWIVLVALCFALGIVAVGEGQPLAAQRPSGVAEDGSAEVTGEAILGTPIGTAFTYQGQIRRNGQLVNGVVTLGFKLYDAVSGGNQVGSLRSHTVAVNNGLFTIAELDFGNVFTGEARWLQVGVCDPGPCSPEAGWTWLTSRTRLNAVPYATNAQTAQTAQSALTLQPGAVISGTAYQNLKVVSRAAEGQWYPAAVVGEIVTSNGVGVVGHSSGAMGSLEIRPKGVWGLADAYNGIGVEGFCASGEGVKGASTTGTGVWGTTSASVASNAGVFGEATGGGYGVKATSENGPGLYAYSHNGLAAEIDGTAQTKMVRIIGGSDLAEKFAISNDAPIEPGTLLVIDEQQPGRLKASITSYDTKVAGIASGAGGVQAGLTLYQEGVLEGDTTVAIAGRAYVKAEALSSPIKPGDLLTSSAIPGHAMKAADPQRRQGAIIGKAMTGLEQGTGLVLVLVNLQ